MPLGFSNTYHFKSHAYPVLGPPGIYSFRMCLEVYINVSDDKVLLSREFHSRLSLGKLIRTSIRVNSISTVHSPRSIQATGDDLPNRITLRLRVHTHCYIHFSSEYM